MVHHVVACANADYPPRLSHRSPMRESSHVHDVIKSWFEKKQQSDHGIKVLLFWVTLVGIQARGYLLYVPFHPTDDSNDSNRHGGYHAYQQPPQWQ